MCLIGVYGKIPATADNRFSVIGPSVSTLILLSLNLYLLASGFNHRLSAGGAERCDFLSFIELKSVAVY